MSSGPGWTGISLRILFALLLVFLTYNPFGWSYFHWAVQNLPDWSVLKIVAGVALLIGWVIYVNSAYESLGIAGLVLAAVFVGSLIWLIASWGWIPADSFETIMTLALLLVGLVLGIGMCWSHIRRRLSGQYDVDELEG